MAEKDVWDKSEVIIKLIGGVVLVAIPIMISIGATRIGQSMERGKLVDSLLAELANEEKKMRRDLALIALDASVPPPERCKFLGFFGCELDETAPDMVADIAIVLWRELDNRSDQTEAANIITKRKPTTHVKILAAESQVTSDLNPEAELTPEAIAQRAQTAEILSRIVESEPKAPDTALIGVRAVYIQYRADKAKAIKIERALRDKSVTVPRIELVPAIRQNDIRYPGPDGKKAAGLLRDYLKSELRIEIPDNKLIDLSKSGYRVPAGQFEVWLNE